MLKLPGNKKLLIFLVFVLALSAVILLSSSQRQLPEKQSEKQTSQLQPTSVASTPRTLPQGKIPFEVSSGNKSGPAMTKGFIDPYDPNTGENQTINIEVADSQPVTSVVVTMKTDNQSVDYSLSLVEGTATLGTWQGTWEVADTHLYYYHAIVEAVSSRGSSYVDITLR